MPEPELYHLIMSPLKGGGRLTVAFEADGDDRAVAFANNWIRNERIPAGAKVCVGRPGGERVVIRGFDHTAVDS